MIRLENVSKHYGSKKNMIRAAQDISFEVAEGDFVLITGPSGSGKTTLLNLVGGMTRPDSGKVFVAGKNLRDLSDKEISRFRANTIGFVFQFQCLIPTLNVLENVKIPFLFRDETDAHERAKTLIAHVGLEDRLDAYANELSIGQQRRVCIARALVHRPAILLCDEPTGDLDPETESIIMEMIAKANKDGATVLMATHNHDLLSYATRTFAIQQGCVS